MSDPGFPARYLGFMMVVFTIACMIALGAFVISLSVAWHGSACSGGRLMAYGARCGISGSTLGWVVSPTEVGAGLFLDQLVRWVCGLGSEGVVQSCNGLLLCRSSRNRYRN